MLKKIRGSMRKLLIQLLTKRLLILRITEHDDERVQALEYRSYAEAGFLIAVLSALDVIIRGLILNHSPNEWGMSTIRFI